MSFRSKRFIGAQDRFRLWFITALGIFLLELLRSHVYVPTLYIDHDLHHSRRFKLQCTLPQIMHGAPVYCFALVGTGALLGTCASQ